MYWVGICFREECAGALLPCPRTILNFLQSGSVLISPVYTGPPLEGSGLESGLGTT